MKIPKVLAIDYGTVRVGIAVSAYTLADPLVTIPQDTQLFSKIVQLSKENEVDLILVGLSENVMALRTKSFVEKLKEYTSIPIKFTDETLSSNTAHKKLQTSKKSKRSGDIDHYAAAEFLQEWLDENFS